MNTSILSFLRSRFRQTHAAVRGCATATSEKRKVKSEKMMNVSVSREFGRRAVVAAVFAGTLLGAMLRQAKAADATWMGNSFLIVNGTWYNGTGSGNTAIPSSLGNLSSITLGAEIQTYGDDDGAGNPIKLIYKLDDGSWSSAINVTWFKYANNNNYFHLSPFAVDIRSLNTGSHHLYVKFYRPKSGGDLYDDNKGEAFCHDLPFTKVTTSTSDSITLTGSGSGVRVWVGKTDYIDRQLIAVSSYGDGWDGKKAVGGSSAIYGGCTTGSDEAIEISNSSPRGLWSTKSGGYVRRVTVKFKSSNTGTLTVFLRHMPYASGSLYEGSARGLTSFTLSGTGVATSDVITDNYEHIGMRSFTGGGTVDIDWIKIEWEEAGMASVNLPATITGLEPNTEYTFGIALGTSLSSSGTAWTTIGTTPTVTATGLDSSKLLWNWTQNEAGSYGYFPTNNTTGTFATHDGVSIRTDFRNWVVDTGAKTVANAPYEGHTYSFSSAYVYEGNFGREIYLSGKNSYFETAAIKAPIKSIRYTLRAAATSSYSTRKAKLQYNTGSGWVDLGTDETASYYYHKSVSYTPSSILDGGENGVKFRWTCVNTVDVLLGEIDIQLATEEGHSKVLTSASSGPHYMRVRKNGHTPEGTQSEWSSTLSATLGVVPGSSLQVDSVTSDSITFSWNGNASASGYIVDATTVPANNMVNVTTRADGYTFVWPAICETGVGSLLMNDFDDNDWKYIGESVSVSADSTFSDETSSPVYKANYGHLLIGRAGNGIQSKAFSIAGATGLKLTYSVGAWNLNEGTGLEAGRVNAYYSLDGGPWCFLGSGVPTSAASNGNLGAQEYTLPQGALDGSTIAFKLVAPNAEPIGGKLRGPYISALKVICTSVGSGDYSTHLSNDYPDNSVSGGTAKQYTMSDLPANTPIYFRVQALQSGGAVKSVWVEGNATTLAAQTVTFSPVPTAVAVGESIALSAAGSQESPTITYSVEPGGTGSARLEVAGGVTNLVGVTAGTVTVRATAAATTHYPAGTYAEVEVLVRPARPTTQATLLATDTRTVNGFRLNYRRGGDANSSGATIQNGVLILVKAGSAPTEPTDGEGVKSIGATSDMAWSGGEAKWGAQALVNAAAGAPGDLQHKKITSGAESGTHYYAAAYAYRVSGSINAGNETYTYMTTPAATTDFWTLKAEPTATAGVAGAKVVDEGNQATVTYDSDTAGAGAGADRILVVVMPYAGAAMPTPEDGREYSGSLTYGNGEALGNGYVVYAGDAAATGTLNLTGLASGTEYIAYAFLYNRVSGESSTANYKAGVASAAFETDSASGPEGLDAETTRYEIHASWEAMTPPTGQTVSSYTVEATACGGNGAKTTNACPDGASLASTYDPTKAAHGAADAWSYRLSVKSASNSEHSYPGWSVNGQNGHELLGRWTTTSCKPAVESPVINLSGAAGAEVTFQMRSYESKNGYSSSYAGRSPVTLYWSTNGGTTWTNGTKTGNGNGSFAAQTLTVPAEALVATAKFQLRADSAAGYSIVTNGTTNYYAAGPVVKEIKIVQTATATGDYASTGCPVAAGNIAVDGTNAVITGLTTNKLYYYRVKANFSGGTSSHWTESSATTKGQMEAPGSSASAERYAGTVSWTAPEDESANVTAWHVQVTSCTSGGSDEATTNACPDGALTVAGAPIEDAWTYTNRASGYPSWQKWGGYNGGAHFLVGTGGSASSPTPKGIVSEQLNLSGMGGAYVRFMHSPNLQNPVAKSYITLYYSLDDGANWTKVKTLEDAGQVWPSLAYKELKIDLPAAALAEGVYLKLSADSAYQQVTESATNQFGARLEGIEVVATPLRQDWDFTCPGTMTSNYTSLSDAQKAAMDQTFGVLGNATSYGYRVWATDEGRNASATNSGQFTTLAGQNPPVQIWADPVKQTQVKLQWDAAPEATAYEIQMTKCADKEWERVVIAASPTNARLSALDDWSYIGGGTDVDAVENVKRSETNYITEGGFYPTFADGGNTPENSQVLAGEGAPGMMSAVFSTVGATNAALSFNFGRWYVKGGLKNVDAAAASNAAVLTAYYSLDGGESWENWFKTESATNYAYTYTGTYGTANQALPAAALGQENVRIKLVAEDACIMDVSTKAGTSYVTNHAVGVAVALAQVKLQGVTGDYSSSGCRVDDGTWTVPATAEELSVLVTNLEANSNYYFRVRATDGATDPVQYGAWTDGAAKTLAAPEKVRNLTAGAIGRYAFTLGWDASARAESYIAYVRRKSDNALVGTYPAEGLSVRVAGLAANTTYSCKVVAVADGVEWDGIPAGEPDTTSDAFEVTTANAISITGLAATDINPTSMTIVWDGAGSGAGAQNILTWGEAGTDGGTGAVEETIECPAETLKRTDSGNGWFYVGGSASYPAYWVNSNNPTADQGHALIYKTSGVAPGIRSRWFDTYGATNVTVEFLHGRFNASANSAVELDYSLDGGENWTYAGTTPTSSASTPTDLRSIALPAAALNRKSVMIQLSAPGADGNKGAHVKDLKIRIRGRRLETGGGNKTWTGAAQCEATSWKLTGLAPGKRYWFALRATDDGNTWVEATNTASTYAMRTGVLASQGFEDETTDTTPWATNLFWIPWSSTGWYTNATWEAGYPTVEVVENENPLYGRKALRLSGSAAANAFGVADFTYALGSRGGVVTIPFSAKDLAKDDCLYVAYKRSDGDWTAPGGTDQTSMGGVPLTRIGCGINDAINRNWPYNRGVNTTTRPKGDAYSFEVPAGSAGATLTVRVAFCGQSGGANRYYYIDELALEEAAGIPDPVSASKTSDGHVQLTWTSPEGQKVVIIRGQDMREPPGTGAPDLSALPEGYEVVMNGTETQWPAGAGSHKDEEATSGWRYYYYFYAVTASGTIGKTPAVAWTMVGGMVKAIASQGWDGWDVHPWNYRLGRVTNPGRSSDAGYWRDHGQNTTNSYVRFFENEFETDSWPARGSGSGSYKETTETYGGKTYTYRNHWVTNYATLYGATGDADRTNQLGVSTLTNYYGDHAFRLSGGGGTEYRGQHVYYDFDGTKVTNSDCYINTNNAAIEFANVDLTGYKNVEFQLHYAGAIMGGGNYLHVAISTNGGAEGTWQAVHNKASSGWAVTNQSLDYGLQLQEMSNKLVGETVNFYSQELVQYGNPFILKVPDSVTQFMARVMFYDSNGRNIGWRHATYFIDEVRLLGEVALETPRPRIREIGTNGFNVTWTNVPGADRYNVRVTSVASNEAVKLTESFAVQGTLDWTATGSVSYTAEANRQGGSGSLGYGLVLGDGGALASAPVGCAGTVSYWARGGSFAVQIGSGDHWETITNVTASGSWTAYTNALPHRQWQSIRFLGVSGPVWVDDIEVRGAGNYATTVFAANGVTDTNCPVTGLANGTRYFVSVQAVEDVTDGGESYEIKSPWGETADYTAGIFTAEADGFEMMRLGWGNPGNGIVVIAVTNGDASAVATPAKDAALAVGTQVVAGSAVVVASDTESADGFEHVWPYKGDGAAAQYVVFWKHGAYWEGRLETNVATGVYVCDAADAMAYTNGWMMSAATAQAPLDGGKGWDGPWTVVRKQWDDAGSVTKNASGTEGLLETNQLWGAGGNMLVLYPGSDNQSYAQEVYVKRKLATALSADRDWWGMFAMKISNMDSPAWAGIDLLAGETSQASIGKLWDDAKAGISDQYSTYGIDAAHTYVYVFKWDHASKTLSLHVEYVNPSTGAPVWNPSVGTDLTLPEDWDWHASKSLPALSDITHIQLSTKSDANKHLGDVYFDEIRIGPDWPSLIGKQELPPAPAYDLQAVRDGNEMVRLSWKYRAAGIEEDGTTSNPLREHANGVVVLATTSETGFTASEIAALRTAAVGTTSGNAEVVWRADVATSPARAVDELDHVVMPGTLHRYAVITRNGSAYTNAVTSGAVETDLYGEREWVNPFSYTNGVEYSVAYPSDWATTYNGTWRGGHGFETGLTQHYWAKGGAGTWTPVKPENVTGVDITNDIANYWPGAGNVMQFIPGDQTNGYLKRNLNAAWCGNVNDTFYVAFRMAYRWNGNNKWAGLRFIDNGGSGAHSILFGKVGTTENAAGIAGVPGNSDSEGNWAGSAGSLDDYGNSSDTTHAYLVVGKVQWTGPGTVTASLCALKTGQGGATLPVNESDVAWTVTQSGLQLRNVNQFQLEAGAKSGYGDIGQVYFDEIRFGTTWDDIVGPADPTDVRMALLTGESDSESPGSTAYKGDIVSFDFESLPDGKKQTAAGWLSRSNSATSSWDDWADVAAATNTGSAEGWVQWRATNVQLTAAGHIRAGGSVTGSTLSMHSWERTAVANRRWRLYEVKPLSPPTDIHPEGGILRNLFDWIRWADDGRTFEQVMVVRFANTADRGNWTPVDGTAYAQGATYDGGKIVCVGTETNCVDTGLARDREYFYAFYTVNNDHYSTAATADCRTLDEDPSVPTVDGDPTDWVGIPSVVKNSATTSEGEWIWTDKVGEERKDSDFCKSADLTEFRIKADATDVYFLVRLSGGEGIAATNAYAAVSLTTSGLASGNADGEKWIGAPGNTLMGGAYWRTNASLHYADREMAVHWVADAPEGRKWQVELWDKNGGHWYAATNWAAAGSADGAADACIEWRVPRDTLGLTTDTYCITGRFTVATFVNSGSWNNQAPGTAQIGDNGKSRAVDAMAIAPYGQNDKNLALGAWEEGLASKEVPFWADVRFESAGLHANEAPATPTGGRPDGESTASPWMQWNAVDRDGDFEHYEGFVTGYFLEVSTNATYNGVGDGTENGPIAYRVNLEGANTTSNRFITEGSNYWWRVRARDNSGELSAPGEWHYVVTGKKDNTGPVAKLLYVGTNVMRFLNDPAYRSEEERSGDATSVLDSELEDGGHDFGFVIEWYDASGVYAKNRMRKWEEGDCAWPDGGKPVGSFAWNVYATHDGHPEMPFGRVSPNWDLLVVDRSTVSDVPLEGAQRPAQPSAETVDGNVHPYVWATNGLVLPKEDGGSETAYCWYIDCGKDSVFWENEMLYNGNTGPYLTNYVTNAFSISTYRPGVELYLTVSAEDCCTDTGDPATSGDAGWYGWPWWNTEKDPDDPGSWKGIEKEYQDSKLSGWCADGPHMGRNVTTNQLLKFYVRDNDVIPPVVSTEKWKTDARNGDNEAFYPFMAVARGTATAAPENWNPTWAALSGEGIGLLPVVEGIGRGATYQLTDADLVAGGKLRFFFNVYDEYIHSGVKRGTGDPGETVHKVSPPSDRTLTNSAFFARTWDATAAEGAGAWVDGTTNRTAFAAGWSKIYDLTENESNEFVETAGPEGTGPSTVLAWEFDASVTTMESIFGMTGLFDYIGTHTEGVTNKIMLDAWDSDNNGQGDQAHDNLEFGRLVLRDDDTTPPTAPGEVTVKVGGTPMTAATPIWTNRIGSISLSFAEATDPDSVASGMHEKDLRGSGVASYRVAKVDAPTPGVGTQVTTNGSGTLSATFPSGDAISQGLVTNYLFAVDADADRDGDALAGEAVGFVTAYDATRPTSVAANSFNADSSNEEDPTSMMLLQWEEPAGGMGPDSGAAGISAYSPWETYKIYFTNFVPASGEATWSDGTVRALSNGFALDRTKWMNATCASNAAYGDLNKADTTNVVLRDLEPGENYIFAIVGLDKAGNESLEPRFALGDTIKFMVTQGVVRAWGELTDELNAAALGGEGTFSPVRTDGTRGTPTLYWDARINTNTHRTSRGYSLVYRDDTAFREGTDVAWTKAGSSISNNYYAEPDGGAQKLGRGTMRFYRATYAGRERKTDGVTPLASEEVYALHNVKLSQGRNFVALHGVPYTNTFRGVFGCDTNYWPTSPTMGGCTRVEFFDGLSGTNTVASEIYAFNIDVKMVEGTSVTNVGWFLQVVETDNGTPTNRYVPVTDLSPGIITNATVPREWYYSTIATNDGTVATNWYNAAGTKQSTVPALDGDFFTRGFAINLPERKSDFYSTDTVDIVETVVTATSTNLATRSVPVFDWSPILQMPTNGTFSVTVHCGTNETKTIGRKTFVQYTGVDTFVAFRAPVSVHPADLNLPLVPSTDTGTNGFTYNPSMPATGDRLLIWAAAMKDARIRGDESDCGDGTHPLTATSQMYYDGSIVTNTTVVTNSGTSVTNTTVVTNAVWRWYDKGNSSDPEVTGKPIKPNDAIVIRSFNGGTDNSWTWSYTPTNLYPAADRHFGW